MSFLGNSPANTHGLVAMAWSLGIWVRVGRGVRGCFEQYAHWIVPHSFPPGQISSEVQHNAIPKYHKFKMITPEIWKKQHCHFPKYKL
jgi:hypothetical protein